MPLYSPPQVTIEDEGTGQGDAHTLNFVGAGVSASVAASEATITIAGGAGGAISEVSIPFTDGDTLRRVTVTDAGVSASSKIVGSIRRPDTADDSVDPGYLYVPNVVRVASGAFDVLVACLGWGFDDPVGRPPNETIKYQYTVA